MVAARETTLQELLEGSKQYQVPLYQRTYSWKREQLERLWTDLLLLAEDRRHDHHVTHFVGSLVLAPGPNNGPTGIQEYLVVDGQQRLTTLTLLLCAIRDHRAENESPEHRARIDQQFLTNPWRSGDQYLKVMPTQADRAAYRMCIDGSHLAGGEDLVGRTYSYFRARLMGEAVNGSEVDIGDVESAVLLGLSVVSVTAQAGDNVYRIFESLNNTGLRLTQADLLRNYIFMRLPSQGESVYNSVWLPLQDELDNDELEVLFWLDTVRSDSRVKQSQTYEAQKARIEKLHSEDDVVEDVRRLARLGSLFGRILDPEREHDGGVRRRLDRLRRWGTTTAYPVLLHLLDERARGAADSAQIARAMLYLESFFVRRMLIGRATANMNRILLAAVTELRGDLPIDQAVRHYLSVGRKHYATDNELRAGVRTVPFYLNGRAAQRALFLRWLEESYRSAEPVDTEGLTIEHVMPQTATTVWTEELRGQLDEGEDVDEVYASLLHVLGNLTLTGYNPSLSNSPFDTKRELLRTSGLRMNQEIAAAPRWGRDEILARADALSSRIEREWPGPERAEAVTVPGSTDGQEIPVVLAAFPAGRWTTYGELGALVGMIARNVGSHLAEQPVPHAHRVLRSDGTVSPDFRWLDPDHQEDPQALLEAEGVRFDDRARADPAQRMSTEELAELVAVRDGADVDVT